MGAMPFAVLGVAIYPFAFTITGKASKSEEASTCTACRGRLKKVGLMFMLWSE